MQTVTFAGENFNIPTVRGDSPWTGLSDLAVDLAGKAISTAGGSYTLTGADINFGATYGLISTYYKSRSSNVASAGQIRLANTDTLKFRNGANDADLSVSISANRLAFEGSKLIIAGAAEIVNADISAAAAIAYSKLNLSGSIVNADINAAAAIAYSKLSLTGSIVNADIGGAAAIAYSKLAALTASRALVSDGSGVVSVSAVTSTELGYVAGVTSAIQTQLDTKIAGTNQPVNILINGGMEFWQRNTTFSSPSSGTYTADRWQVLKSGGGTPTFTVSKETSTVDQGGASLKLHITALSTMTTCYLAQSVENFSSYKGKTVTVSMRVNTDSTAVQVSINDGVTTTVSSSSSGGGSFETLTVTKTLSASATAFTIGVGFVTNNSVTSTTYIDNVMCVLGSTAVTFVPMDYQMELARCQRYYQKSYLPDTVPGTASVAGISMNGQTIGASTTAAGMLMFKVPMRIAPSVTLYAQDGTSGSWAWRSAAGATTNRASTVDLAQINGFVVTQGVNTTDQFGNNNHFTADAEM